MKVYFARHGETEWNARRWVQGWSDTELNAVGLEQARRLGENLAARSNIVHVYSSRMRRAHTTAQIVARRLGVPCESRQGLQEIALGDWEGSTWRQIECCWPEAYGSWQRDKRNCAPPNGESYSDVLRRFVPAVLKILKEAKGDVLIVAHSGCLLAFQAELNGTPLETMHRDYSAPNGGAFSIDAQRILERWGSMECVEA